MKTKKILLICLCVVAIVAASVLGTLAYLTDREAVTNTFTVGNVDITLDEEKVTPDGKPTPEDDDRVNGNEYHLIPGQTYTKDPTMTVVKGSEESYVRMLVTINCYSELKTIFGNVDLTTIFNGYDAATWIYQTKTENTTDNTVTYEFRYKETVDPAEQDVKLDALFDSFTVPGTLTGEQLAALADLEIVVNGHAIQAVGFEKVDDAWAAFDAQMTEVQP